MPRVGFEPTIPVFERAKTIHAFHRVATVICDHTLIKEKYKPLSFSLYIIFNYAYILSSSLLDPSYLHASTTLYGLDIDIVK
jgi:hypothetical protein